MRLAYVTAYDSLDVTKWSGTGYYISKALEDQGIKLVRIGGLRHQKNPINIARHLWNTRVLGKRDHAHRDPGFLRSYARQVSRRLNAIRQEGVALDGIFVPGILPIAFLETDLPIFVWTDCTFAGLLDYYPAWTNLSERSIRDGHEADRRGLQRADVLIFTSEWASVSAIEDYGCDRSRVHEVPLGANVAATRTPEIIDRLASNRLEAKSIKLLLPGVNWQRKGCDFAIEVARCVNDLGHPAELSIVGCNPPLGRTVPNFVNTHGFVSKAQPEGRAFIEREFEEANFLILPTIAECTAVVFNEAASYGLPVFTTDTGGTLSIVLNGKNGFTYSVDSDPARWAMDIVALLQDPDRYRALCLTSFQEFCTRLNWQSAGARVHKIIASYIANAARPSTD
jgi:glycosyltransferase involved in cell wall biosynthesis